MSKKSLLSCTAVAAVMLFGTHLNAKAEILNAQAGKTITESKKTYQVVRATNGGTIYGTYLTILGPSLEGDDSKGDGVVTAYNYSHDDNAPRSTVELYGNTIIKSGDNGLIAEKNGTIKMNGGTIDSQSSMAVGARLHESAVIELNDVAINAGFIGILASSNAMLSMTGGSINAKDTGVDLSNELFLVSERKNIRLENVTINSGKTGIYNLNYNVTLKNVTITSKDTAIVAYTIVPVASSDNIYITVSGGSLQGDVYGIAGSGFIIILDNNVKVISNGCALRVNDAGKIVMTGGTVESKDIAFVVAGSGKIDATGVSAKAEKTGMRFEPGMSGYGPLEINLVNTELFVESGVGIITVSYSDTLNLKNSVIYDDILLIGQAPTQNGVGEKGTFFILNADSSSLEGRAKMTNNSTIIFNLKNGTTWFLKNSEKERDENGKLLDITQRSRSDVSVLNLNDSKIVFDKPVRNHYHTLHIGSGKPDTTAVYNASGNAEIHFNIEWSDGATKIAQKNDRVIIHGDTSGTTTIYFKGDVGDGSEKIDDDIFSNTRGLSLIQVSGIAHENSFKLAHDYITTKGLPYKYILAAYGPESSNGKANVEQSFFEKQDEDFWDFRLQNAFLDKNGKVKALVPQAASYIVMPNALFYAGFSDIAKQSSLLANIRTTQNHSFFVSPYGNTATLTSQRGPLKYGYGADIRYAAVQAGEALAGIENKNITMHFGVMGTYGQLSFTPQDMEGADKSTLNKWGVTAFGSLQHNNGLYVDILASYGMISGDISTTATKNAANLKDPKTFSASATVGKEFATGIAGIEFEPQAQLVYQQLSFDTFSDSDKLKVDMKNPHQWLARIGGRLTKMVSMQNDYPVSVSGKVNLLKTFGDDGSIKVGDNFDLDPTGTSLEGGVGINAQLSSNFSLHGDVSYQQKLQKTGISGASFSGGIRYQF